MYNTYKAPKQLISVGTVATAAVTVKASRRICHVAADVALMTRLIFTKSSYVSGSLAIELIVDMSKKAHFIRLMYKLNFGVTPLTVNQQVIVGASAGVAFSFLATHAELISCTRETEKHRDARYLLFIDDCEEDNGTSYQRVHYKVQNRQVEFHSLSLVCPPPPFHRLLDTTWSMFSIMMMIVTHVFDTFLLKQEEDQIRQLATSLVEKHVMLAKRVSMKVAKSKQCKRDIQAKKCSLTMFVHVFWPKVKVFQKQYRESAGSEESAKFSKKGQENDGFSANNFYQGFLLWHRISSQKSVTLSWSSSRSLSSIASLGRDTIIAEDLPSVSIPHSDEVEFNRVNYLVWVLHESARSFSLAIQNQPLATSGPELSNAWIGVDVHLWHKRMAYQVAVYALLKAAIEVELFLSQKRYNSPIEETTLATLGIFAFLGRETRLFLSEMNIKDLDEQIKDFLRENLIKFIEETTLATLGIFAFLGRETRLFLSEMNIKDLDEQIKDFLSYLECGSLYICPEFNSLPEYQLFIEVVVDEIGWLDFYAPLRSKFHHDGRRSRQHAIQAEKEIILYTVLTVCYDVFSGYAHYSNSSQQPMDKKLLSFLLRSQTLLSSCLEEYWAAYDKSGESMKFSDRVPSDSTPSVPTNKAITSSSILLEAQQNPVDLMKRRSSQDGSTIRKGTNLQGERGGGSERKPLYERFVRDSTKKLVTVSNDIWMGTRLLFIDVKDAFGLLVKQLRGNKITNRERGKIDRTLNDLANLVPITILMLIPIPSPYSSKRLNLVKQLERTKKMEVESWAAEDLGRARETSKEKEEDKSLLLRWNWNAFVPRSLYLLQVLPIGSVILYFPAVLNQRKDTHNQSLANLLLKSEITIVSYVLDWQGSNIQIDMVITGID
ncbi:LETM1-like protein [Artemisia annua]|uniref:LETM1-like protein n=1 Tax=Artemisia annua TaxID=35608 RepID=A0A2U1KKP5_ARTAN|nr:LETM1-like protein [Artemisia annua]